MPISVDALFRRSVELASDIMKGLVDRCWSAGAGLRCWSVGYAGALCAGQLLIPLSPTAPGTL